MSEFDERYYNLSSQISEIPGPEYVEPEIHHKPSNFNLPFSMNLSDYNKTTLYSVATVIGVLMTLLMLKPEIIKNVDINEEGEEVSNVSITKLLTWTLMLAIPIIIGINTSLKM